jgi:NAD(P)H-hydrate repair Nnr-like enzyme with NAD(P)H-hydrate epimerase domain
MSRPLGVAVGAVLAALMITACGGKVIDDGKAEGFIEDGLQKQAGLKVSSVDCPSDVDVEKGKTLDCTAETDRGRYAVTLRMTDDEGTVVPARVQREK